MPAGESALPSDPEASDAAAEMSAQELNAYVRRNLIATLVVLLLLVGGMGLAGVFFKAELAAVTAWVARVLGLPGLSLILFASDSVITPIPPDALLVVVASSELAHHWFSIVLYFGVLSSVAGNVGWWLGRRFGDTRLPSLLFGRLRDKNEALVARYGRVGVALGALTPIPFSVTCWAAGMFNMRWRDFWWVTLLRIPRFFVYYLAIAESAKLWF